MKSLSLLLSVAVFCCGCATYPTRDLLTLDKSNSTHQVTTPVKIHLKDGSVILSQEGYIITNDTIHTADSTFLYSFTRLEYSKGTFAVPIDSVEVLEHYKREMDVPKSAGNMLLSTAGIIDFVIIIDAVAKAIHGFSITFPFLK